MEEAEQAMVGLDQSFDPNAELEDWGPFQPGLGEETRSPSGMYDEEDMDGAFWCWVVGVGVLGWMLCMFVWVLTYLPTTASGGIKAVAIATPTIVPSRPRIMA